MASPAPINRGRRLRLAVAGAAVLTALTVATAGASPPAPMGAARLGTGPSQDPRASSPAPGFLLERGRFTTVAIPRRLAATAPQGIGPMGINDRRQIVDEYIDDRAVSRGFLLDRHGRFTRLDFPGSRSSQARSINDRGQVVGEYQDAAGSYHGYVWERGRFRTIDAPGAAGTSLFDSNDRGQLLGIRLQLDGTSAGSCWTGAGSPPSTVPAGRSPTPSASTRLARSWASASIPPT